MSSIEEKLLKIPVLKQGVLLCKKIVVPGFEGLSVFDLIKTYLAGIVKGTFSPRAGSIAFSFFMALFPFLLFLLNLIPYIPVNETDFLNFISEILPAQTNDFFLPIIEDIARNPRGGLLSIVFLVALFLMSNGVNAIFSGFEYSIHVTINRNFIKQYIMALAVSILIALLLLLTVVIIVYSEYIIADLKSGDYISNDIMWISTIRYIIFVLMIYFVIAILYYYGTKEKSSRFFSLGALVTTLLFLATTYFFGVYINNFSNYNELYGSIGALLIMMLYIWINSNLLLLGFELNATLKILKKPSP